MKRFDDEALNKGSESTILCHRRRPRRYLTTEVAGGFTGRVIGMYATRGTAAFDWFELRPA